MDEPEYPDFGNAYPTMATTPNTEAASWNPALRSEPESHRKAESTTTDDDFFDRYPGATPKKGQATEGQDYAEPTATFTSAPAGEAHDGGGRRQSITVQHIVDIRHETATPDEQRMAPQSTVEIQGPLKEHVHDNDEEAGLTDGGADYDEQDEEDQIFRPDVTAQQQEHDLEESLPAVESVHVQETDESVQQADQAAAAPTRDEDAARPASHYEHQGDITEMEEAQDESAGAPLMDDEEEPPMIEEVSTRHVPSLDQETSPRQSPSTVQHPPPHIERSFTTNFTEMPGREMEPVPETPQNRIVSDEWPAAGDDKTFGELLDDEQQPAPVDSAANKVVEPAADDRLEGDDATFGELLDGHEAAAQEPVLRDVAADDAADDAADVAAPDASGEPQAEDLAAAWQAALDDDDLLDESNDLDPSKFFGDDDDGFLEDEQLLPPQEQQQPQSRSAPSQYRPTNVQQQSRAPTNGPYSSATSQLISQSHGRSAGTPDTGLFDIYSQSPVTSPQQQPQATRPGLQQAQSFADKAKGGYQSPYDLPMEVVKPRRRPAQTQQPSGTQAQPAPPPRTSSFQSLPATPLLPPQRTPSVPTPPPSSSHSASSAPPVQAPNGAIPAKGASKTDSGFFADLPMTTKPRARPSGAYTPRSMSNNSAPAPQGPPQPYASQRPASIAQPSQLPVAPPAPFQQPPQPAMYGSLRQPERMPLLPDQPTAPQTMPTSTTGFPPTQPVPSQTRYSPAPPAPTTQPAAASRYSPAPAAQQQRQQAAYAPKREPSFQQAHPFAPRTSSPLAYATEKPHPPLPPEAALSMTQSPPRLNGVQTSTSAGRSPERQPLSRYSPAPVDSYSSAAPMATQAPPPRAKTGSPSQSMKQPRFAMTQPNIEARSTSAESMPSYGQLAQSAPAQAKRPALPHKRQFSRDLTYATPNNELALDPLERWKGHPIFNWTASGAIVSSFPKQTPFYAAGHGIPSIQCTPGNISVQNASTFMPMDERDAKFPGPLPARSRGKKKEVLAWLTGKIEGLERVTEGAMLDFDLSADLKKRTDERSVLWKLMKIFVEHDGVLEGNPKIEEEVRRVLLPNLAQMNQVMDLQSPTSATVQSEGVDKGVLLQLRQALLEGQRERAVWLAEEKKLWGHAMLIASTLGPEIWRQIIQAFVRSQVKSVGSDARSLAALYQIFAGNSEECVDELVPPSARAGFQMVSKTDGSVTGNPLEGLDQWRETLGLVVSNRTPSDPQSLVALGKLLSGYGRVEAAHCCFLFARQAAKHSGADDKEANFVLLGANLDSAADEGLGGNLDPILLTEVYEWASSLSAPTTASPYMPHLQSYKLQHAQNLAAYGLRTKAQQYCDHITSAYTSTTRPSQYYHPTFTTAVADLSAFLSQTPHDGKGGGLFSKPAMNKVSSGAASWFTKFVSGDDDQDSNASGSQQGRNAADEAGPFGRVSGEISRNTSGTNLYNPMMMGGAASAPLAGSPAYPLSSTPSSAAGPYAPTAYGAAAQGQPAGGRYAPHTLSTFSSGLPGQDSSLNSPTEITRSLGVPSLDQQQRPSSARAASSRCAPSQAGQGFGLQPSLGVPRPEANRATSDYGVPYGSAPASRRGSAQDPGSQGSYEPRPSLTQDPSPYAYQPQQVQQPAPEPEDAFAPPASVPEPATYEPSLPDAGTGGYEPPTGGYEPPASGYGPPTTYQPYEPEPEAEEEADSAPKPKKSFTDDDEDDAEMAKRAAALKKTQADRAADEAFRKAAEADAARDGDKGDAQKAGWFGGWFGGKKDPKEEIGKPIKAKLGEENSFYYDENLKKWVNKKGGAETATSAAATPPPPKGPPSRVASGTSMAPPSGPPSRVMSGVGLPSGPPMSGPPSRAGTPASIGPDSAAGTPGVNGEARPPSGPPSRPPTSMSTASSLDDLLGGPPGAGARKAGGTVKGKKKGGRYVDVMAK